jgi:hypothetical protein
MTEREAGTVWSASSPASRPGPQGTDTRFIVTSLATLSGRTIYQDIYCARGQAENHIKAWKTHLASKWRPGTSGSNPASPLARAKKSP